MSSSLWIAGASQANGRSRNIGWLTPHEVAVIRRETAASIWRGIRRTLPPFAGRRDGELQASARAERGRAGREHRKHEA